MAISDPKTELHSYLQEARAALLWKLDGLSEYDARRPLTPTGTNLLGLVKHLPAMELGYFGDTFGRPVSDAPAWPHAGSRSTVRWAEQHSAGGQRWADLRWTFCKRPMAIMLANIDEPP